MKKRLSLIVFFISLVSINAQSANWKSSNPLEKKFIHNSGQNNNQSVKFYLKWGLTSVDFEKDKIKFSYAKMAVSKKKESANQPSVKSYEEIKNYHFSIRFLNTNDNYEIIGQNPLKAKLIFSGHEKNQLESTAFEKILYKNIYDGIDIEYSYASEGKFKYNIIVHENGNINDLSYKYNGLFNPSINNNGALELKTKRGVLTESNPVVENHPNLFQFHINNNIVSFKANQEIPESYIIDPWISLPEVYDNYALELDYDLQGNVYTYGVDANYSSGYVTEEFVELAKFNDQGTLLWYSSYTTSSFYGHIGELAVDRNTGICYVVNGDYLSPLLICDNGNFTQQDFHSSSDWFEAWKINFDHCTGDLVIGGGGGDDFEIAISSSNYDIAHTELLNIVGGNYNGAMDVSICGIDPYSRDYYFVIAKKQLGGPLETFWDSDQDPGNLVPEANLLYKINLNDPNNLIYSVPTDFNFLELKVYYAHNPPPSNGNQIQTVYYAYMQNAINGMTFTRDKVITYDGSKLRAYSKVDGSLVNSIDWGGEPVKFSGLSADLLDNIYVGRDGSIEQYDPCFNLVHSYDIPSRCYDLQVWKDKIYACGPNFITEIKIDEEFTDKVYEITDASCDQDNGSIEVTFDCSPENIVDYTWSTGDINTEIVSNLSEGEYYLHFTADENLNCIQSNFELSDTIAINDSDEIDLNLPNDTIACQGESILITLPLELENLIWNDGSTSIQYEIISEGAYSFNAELNGCNITDTIEVSFADIFNFNLGNDSTICGDEFILTFTPTVPNNFNFNWNTGETTEQITINQSGQYYLEINNTPEYCASTDTINISLIQNDLNFPTDSNFCNEVNLQLGSLENADSYNWSTGEISESISIVDTGLYWVEVQVQDCIIRDSILVSNTSLSPSFDYTPSGECGPITISFLDTTLYNNIGNISWQWNFGDGASSTEQNPSHTFTSSTNNEVEFIIVYSNNCTDTSFVDLELQINPEPIAEFIWEGDTSMLPSEITFINNSLNASQFNWNIGETNSSSFENPNSVFEESGSYFVELIVIDEFGCSDTTSQVVEIVENPTIYFPNSFTPNDDGENDYFQIYATGIQSANIIIANRWGEIIWKGNENQSWDGTYKGELVQEGVYVCLASIVKNDDSIINMTGIITVIR